MTKKKLKLHPRHVLDRHLLNSDMGFKQAMMLKDFMEDNFDKKKLTTLKDLINNFHGEIHPVKKKKVTKKVAVFMKKLQPSKELAVITGSIALTRTQAVTKVWDYIKKHNLQNPKNKRNIIADENLLVILKKKEVTMFELAGLISRHLT